MFELKKIERRLAAIEERLTAIEMRQATEAAATKLVDRLICREEALLDRLMSRSLPEFATYGQRETVAEPERAGGSLDEIIGTIGEGPDETV